MRVLPAALVRGALDRVGLCRVPILTRMMSTAEEAERLAFVGSPTSPAMSAAARLSSGQSQRD
jgi:hypothetical protein